MSATIAVRPNTYENLYKTVYQSSENDGVLFENVKDAKAADLDYGSYSAISFPLFSNIEDYNLWKEDEEVRWDEFHKISTQLAEEARKKAIQSVSTPIELLEAIANRKINPTYNAKDLTLVREMIDMFKDDANA